MFIKNEPSFIDYMSAAAMYFGAYENHYIIESMRIVTSINDQKYNLFSLSILFDFGLLV